jgi:glutamate carboxypeptidase
MNKGADVVYRFDPEEMLEGIREWVMVESPTYHRAGVNRMMDLAEKEMAGLGARIDRIPGREGYGDVVKAYLPMDRDGPGILILSHLDTVHTVGTIDAILPIRREGDRVYGPGIYDMKGGVYMTCCVLRQVLKKGDGIHLPVTYMFIPDEEVGSPTTRDLIEAEAGKNKYVLVTEPAKNGKLVTGRYAFARFRLIAKGRPSHAGSTLSRGRSSIREMARQILQIEDMTDEQKGYTLSVGVISGGTFVNTVPIRCEAQVLAVTQTQGLFDEITGRMLNLRAFNPDVEFLVEPGPVRPMFEPDRAVLELYETAETIAREIGFVPGHGTFGGGSDGNFTGAMGIPTLDGLGVCGDGAHTHDEYLLFSSLEPRARLMAGLLQTLK